MILVIYQMLKLLYKSDNVQTINLKISLEQKIEIPLGDDFYNDDINSWYKSIIYDSTNQQQNRETYSRYLKDIINADVHGTIVNDMSMQKRAMLTLDIESAKKSMILAIYKNDDIVKFYYDD